MTKQPLAFNPLLVLFQGEKCKYCGFVFETQEQMRERNMTGVQGKGGTGAPVIACRECFDKHNKRKVNYE